MSEKNGYQLEEAELEVPCGVKPIGEALHDEVAKCFGAWYSQFEKKNADYGNSVVDVPVLLKDGTPVDAILVRMSDKIARLRTLLAGHEAQVKDETIEDTMGDLAVYCALYCAVKRLREQYVTLSITLIGQPRDYTDSNHGCQSEEEAAGESAPRGYDGVGSDTGSTSDDTESGKESRKRRRVRKRKPAKAARKR